MGRLLDRNREIARRCGDLSPLAQPVRQKLWEGNRDLIMAGVSPGSTRRVAVLRPWAGPPPSYPKRKGSGPERAPKGPGSRIVKDCVISVQAGPARLTFTKSYPTLGEIAVFLDRGTSKMVARPFFEFRKIDLEWVNKELKAYVIPQGFFGRVGAFFGR